MEDESDVLEQLGKVLMEQPDASSECLRDDSPPLSTVLSQVKPSGSDSDTGVDLTASVCPVRLIPDPHSTGFCVVVDGVVGANPNGDPITMAQYQALSELIEAFPDGLTNQELQEDSGVADPAKAVREAMVRVPALGKVVLTPGQARRGLPGVYRIRSVQRASA